MGEAEESAVRKTIVPNDAALALFVFASVTLSLLARVNLFMI